MPVYLGSLNTHEIKEAHIANSEGRAIFLGSVHCWPDYIIKGYDFSTIGNSGKSNYNQQYSIGSKIILDPAGTTVNIPISFHESSWWHFLPINIGYEGQKPSEVSTELERTSINIDNNLISIKSSAEPVINSNYDTILSINIPKNEGNKETSGKLYIKSYINEFNEDILLSPSIFLFEYSQDVNTIFTTHHGWVGQIGDTVYIDNITISATDTTFTLTLFIELGLSVDGGNTYYFNMNNSEIQTAIGQETDYSSQIPNYDPDSNEFVIEIIPDNSIAKITSITQDENNRNYFIIEGTIDKNVPNENTKVNNISIKDFSTIEGNEISKALATNGSSIVEFKVANTSGTDTRTLGFSVNVSFSDSNYSKYNFKW